MIRHAEKVLSRIELAENVWNTQNTRTNFIDVYMNYLRKKIDSDFPNKLIHTRSGTGFILKEKLPTNENSL
jgi:two-component system copper resistance phosphate regulon response regulator CusR